MACFTVPAVEAIVTFAAAKIIEKKEKESVTVNLPTEGGAVETAHKIPFSRKLKWLSWLQLGGCVLLMFEHIWHGEIVPWFPFLAAMSNPADAAEMFHEMATVGVTMAILTTVVWVGMLIVSSLIEKRALKNAPAAAQE